MNATRLWLGALLLAAAATAPAFADPPVPGCIPQAPGTCGPGYYWTDCYGSVHGPAYCVRPCFQPFNGLLPGGGGMMNCAGPPVPVFPSHPYVRGPRDFFMLGDP